MTDEEARREAQDEPVIKVDKRKTRREKREEEAQPASEAAPTEEPEDAQATAAEPEATSIEPEAAPEPERAPEPEAAAPWLDEEESGEEPAAEAQQPVDPFAAVDVYDNLRFLISLFAAQAWVHLGIQAPPGAGETRTDLPQARLAIDMIAVIKEKLSENLTAPERNEIELLLSNLRVNYLQRQTAG